MALLERSCIEYRSTVIPRQKTTQSKEKYTLMTDTCISDFISRLGSFYRPLKLSASGGKDVLHVMEWVNKKR